MEAEIALAILKQWTNPPCDLGWLKTADQEKPLDQLQDNFHQ
jgi:hypothetical protein